MKTVITLCIVFLSLPVWGQKKPSATPIDSLQLPHIDSAIRTRLIELALKNPALQEADAQIAVSKLQVKEAKSAWLNTIGVSGNINEFVINNSTINGVPAATLFPKYNFGIAIPLGIFSAQQKNIARRRIDVNQAQKELQERTLRKEVMIRYENYREKKELLSLQKQVTDLQFNTYNESQREFASGEVPSIRDVNREYEKWIDQRSKQRTRERDLQIAELEIEELIGVPLADVIRNVLSTGK